MTKVPRIENRIENLLLVYFLVPLLFRYMVDKLILFLGQIAISQPILTQDYKLKLSIHTKFDTLISNLNSYVQ